MEQHVKILAVLNIVLGGMGVLAALVVLVVFGGLVGLAGSESGGGEAAVLGLIGGIAVIALAVLSVPCLIAGIGLLKFRSWGQILTIILSILNLMNFPFGTALGIYGLWVLLNKETKPLFKQGLIA
ncbi:MAG TPA: hypothetical protein VFR05_07470 [Terriglobia bacterium]|nr:hypothetical protein [Terriglobia bacterium]